MNLVNDDYTLKGLKFKCLDTGNIYTVVGSSVGERGVENTLDTLVRCDSVRRSLRRSQLKKRFKNVELIRLFNDYRVKKRNKSNRR